MLTLLCTGKLIRDPQQRTSQNGKLFTTALLSVPTDDTPALVSCIAFGETAERLLFHGQGDTLSVLGKARPTQWERDGEVKSGLSLTVDKLLSVYELSKKRNAAAGESTPARKSAYELVDDDPRPWGGS